MGSWRSITPAEGSLGVPFSHSPENPELQGAAKKHSPCLSVVGRSCLDGTNTLCLASLSVMAVAQCPSLRIFHSLAFKGPWYRGHNRHSFLSHAPLFFSPHDRQCFCVLASPLSQVGSESVRVHLQMVIALSVFQENDLVYCCVLVPLLLGLAVV